MGTTIDTNIVQMRFDNEQFERNCAQSMGTLDKLRAKINESNSGNALKGLQDAVSANAIDTKGISSAIEQIQKRFSVLGIAGMTIIQDLTRAVTGAVINIGSTVKGLIYTGGLKRALNIEQARFQITGLKKDWNELSKDIDYAVSGTAYGFDAAARAAAQFAASGVEAGDDMKSALRGISGVAAMTGASYEDISQIFTTVAGNGRAMASELNRIGQRGLNASATIATYFNNVTDGTVEATDSVKRAVAEVTGGLHVTESDIKEFASKGVINFEIFSKAMDSAFGEHAKDANKTFTGVIDNIKAAFARIGADFLTPIVGQESPIVLMLQKVRERVVDLKAELQPLVKVWEALVGYVGYLGQKIIGNFDVKGPMLIFYEALRGIINAFSVLYSVLSPIKQALTSVFPPITLSTIADLVGKFADFIEKLKLSDKHSQQLKTAFEGVFSVIKLLADGVKSALQVIFGMEDSVGSLADAFFDAAEAVGEFLKGITDAVRNSKILQDVAGGIQSILVGFAGALGNAFGALNLKEAEGFQKFSDTLKEATSPIQIFATVFKGAFNLITGIATTVIPSFISVMSKLGTIVKDTFSAMLEAFGNGSGSEAMTVLNSGLLAFILTKVKTLVGSLTGLTTALKGNIIGNVLGQLKDSLFAWQRDLQADAILKLSGAVALLVTSLVMLTGIDTEDLMAATAVVSALFAEMVVAMKYMTTFMISNDGFIGTLTKSFTQMGKLGSMTTLLLTLAASVGILAIAVKSLASINTADLVKGMTAVTILLAEMVIVTKALSSSDAEMTKGISKLILLAAAVDLLTIAVKTLGGMDVASLAKGLGSVGIILLELVGFIKLVDTKSITSAGLAMIPLAAGIDLLTIAVKQLGAMDLASLAKGLVSVGLLLVEISGITRLVDPIKILALGAAIIPIAAGLDLLTIAVKQLGAMDLASLAKGLISVGVLLGEMAAFSALVSPVKLVAASAAMVLMAVGIGGLTASVAALGKLKVSELAKGLVAIAALLAEVGIAATVINPVLLIGLSTGMLIFSAALVPFTGAMAALSMLSWGGILKGLAAIAGAFTVLGVAALVLTPLIPSILGLGAGLTLLGVACMAAGAGITLIATGLTALAGFGVAGVAAITGTLSAMASLIPTLVSLLADLVSKILDAAIVLAPKFAETVITILDAILHTLAEHLPSIISAGGDIVVGLLDGMATQLPRIIESAGTLIANFIIGISSQIPKLIDAGMNAIINLINGMADGIRNNTPLIIEAVNNLMESIVFAIGAWIGNFVNGGADVTNALLDGIRSVGGPATIFSDWLEETIQTIKNKVKDVYNAAVDFVSGFVNGITGGSDDAATAGADLGNSAVTGLRSEKGIDAHSDSKKTTEAGKDFTNGAVHEIQNSKQAFYNAGAEAGDSTVDGYSDKISYLDTLLDRINSKYKTTADSGKDYNAAKQEQLAARKAATEATKEATKAEDDYTEATKKSGGASKKAAEDTKDLGDAFKEVSRGAKVSLNTMINNMADNYRETVLWANDMKELIGKGFDQSIVDACKKMGVGGRETIKAYLTASEEQIPAINALAKRMLTLDEDAKKYIEGDYEAFAADIGNVLSEGITSWNSQLEKVVQDSLDPFGEFDAKTEMTSNKLLANMNSQLKGIRTWGDNLNTLVEKGVNEGIIAHLIELGPKSYEEVNAMVNMTEDQLTEMNNIWEQQSTIGQEIAMKFAEKMREIGSSVSEGFTDGIDYNAVSNAGTDIGTEVTEATKKKLEINSPSRVYQRIGSGVIEGLELGIKVRQHIPVNLLVILATECINKTKEVLSFRAGMDIGSNFIDGLQKGIEDGKSRIIKSIENQAKAVIEAAYAAYDINSPSKEFRKIGLQIDEGLAQGIDWGSNGVLSSVSALGSSTINKMAQVISNIADNVNGEFEDISPVITPRLELTELQNGKSFIDRMFGGTSYSMANSILADQNPSNVNATIESGVAPVANNQTLIFNQTNNSPKSIDAYESYRLGRIALQQMKGAFT